jgi:hypothetical protein
MAAGRDANQGGLGDFLQDSRSISAPRPALCRCQARGLAGLRGLLQGQGCDEYDEPPPRPKSRQHRLSAISRASSVNSPGGALVGGAAASADRLARFRQINLDKPAQHHDALEFSNGAIVLVTNLASGQRATVLQLPAKPMRDARPSLARAAAARAQAGTR